MSIIYTMGSTEHFCSFIVKHEPIYECFEGIKKPALIEMSKILASICGKYQHSLTYKTMINNANGVGDISTELWLCIP